ncbi:MAG: tetratricopeptide repeat protein [Flavobacteriales bacterium]|nr:tetratricopeptide repeat protein [Flavobacteriales bacterium]
MRLLLIGLFLVIFSSQTSSAQQDRVDPFMEAYQRALQHYNSASYATAYQCFTALENEFNDLHSLLAIQTNYYKSRSAMQLFYRDAIPLMERFLATYPNSNLFYEASRNLADYYYQKRDYPNAVAYYKTIDPTQLDKKYRDEYKFNYAYSLFSTDESNAAASFFHDLISKDSEFNSASKYYFGYIAYTNENYTVAKNHFLELIEQEMYLDEIPLYVAQIHQQQEAYEELISFGLRYVDSTYTPSSELYKLLAEAYYRVGDYEQSIYFFSEKYLSSGAQLDDYGYYLLGQAYYRSEEFSLAGSTFNKIVEAEDSLAQNAYYHLADCYLKLGDKRSAQNAFESASHFDFNTAITEHAHFNFAKLCYELGYPYADPTMILQDFINDFPESEYLDEAYSFLVNAFLTHKDYSRAIKSMESSGLSSVRLQQAYQEVSYYRAVQLFNDGHYQKAILHFDKALVHKHNKTLGALSHFWKAESYDRLNEFEKSITSYQKFQKSPAAASLPEYQSASYHIAYAYFKLWKFTESLKGFEVFVGNTGENDMRLHDTYVRLGDSNYMLKNYSKAIRTYEKAVELWGVDADYAAYQIALAYQQLGRYDRVVESLLKFEEQYAKSTYIDDAWYRMGEAYIKLENSEKALEMFRKIGDNFPKSAYVADAKMKIGLVLYHAEDYSKSIEQFKAIVSEYPATTIAREAISNARSVYVDLGDVQSYADWVETLSFVNISTSALDSTAYESAELHYLKGDFKKAFTGFESYVNTYTEGIFKLSAHYYYGESALEIQKIDEALAAFEVVVTYHNNPYTHIALKHTAKLYQQKKMYDEALEKYHQLDDLAETVEAQLLAKKGLMDCYFSQGEYADAIEQAQLILNSGRVDESLILELNTFVARAAFLDLDRDLAAEKYHVIEQNSQGDLKAEAMYHLAYLAFYEGDYERSKEFIFEQSRLLPRYKKWLGKSFIILAKNYWEEEDVFQATHTLDQLLLNIDDAEVLKAAKRLKAEILAKEKVEQDLSLGLDTLILSDSISTTDSLRIIEE